MSISRSVEGQMKKVWYKYLYSATQKENVPFVREWMELEVIVLSKMSWTLGAPPCLCWDLGWLDLVLVLCMLSKLL